MKCPCGLNKSFENCCLEIINSKSAATAEQLMRSRYSAYATYNAKYIFDTYASTIKQEQSVTDITQWVKQCKWVGLCVISTSNNGNAANVEFSANYIKKSKLYQLHENSKFIKTAGNWHYLDGNIINHKELAKIKANDLCPCGSRKKFKKCCGSKHR